MVTRRKKTEFLLDVSVQYKFLFKHSEYIHFVPFQNVLSTYLANYVLSVMQVYAL